MQASNMVRGRVRVNHGAITDADAANSVARRTLTVCMATERHRLGRGTSRAGDGAG